MTARTSMVQGTASSVGKSILVTALCRLFRQEGLAVAPFKSQSMALNAFVTADGGEIGRAQAVQADAARVTATVDMNPILLEPENNSRSQVIVLGKSIGSLSAAEYHAHKPELRTTVRDAFERLRATHDLVVIEGAGSPAENSLKERDIVNMFVAGIADAPVLLAGDIDRGGVFAAFVGTLELLEPHERARIKAFVINKFCGDVRLLDPGLRFLEQRTGVPNLGVVPHLGRLRVADEDSVSLDRRVSQHRMTRDEIEVAVVRLPRISNYDEFQPLEHEAGVAVRFIEDADAIADAHLLVLPGTKTTIADLRWLRESGCADAIVAGARRGAPVLGICGGCQMLGRMIDDPYGVESTDPSVRGLGLLSSSTPFDREKRTSQVRARSPHPSFFGDGVREPLVSYEIHMGRVSRGQGARPAFVVERRNGLGGEDLDGEISADGNVVGTMIHGLLENAAIRASPVASLRARRGLPVEASGSDRVGADQDAYDRLADAVRGHLDMSLLHGLVG